MASFKQKTKLLQGLLTGEKARTGPYHVMVDITRRCNLSCAGCRFHSKDAYRPSPGDQGIKDISLNMFEELCDDLMAMGTRTLFLMGEGEPLLHKQFFEIISAAKRRGFHVTMITNGTLLDRESIEKILYSELDVLQVSLWAGSPKEYEHQYPGSNPDNFNKVINGLKLFGSIKKSRKKRGASVTLHTPINRRNFKTLDTMVDLSLDTGSDVISFSPFLSTKGKMDSLSLSKDDEEALRIYLKGLKKRLKGLPLRHNIERALIRYSLNGKLPCYAGWYHSRIRVDGTVVPCGPCNITMGDLTKKSFTEIWNDLPYIAFRKGSGTLKSLASLKNECDCEYCCYTEDNHRVHKIFRIAAPFFGRKLTG